MDDAGIVIFESDFSGFHFFDHFGNELDRNTLKKTGLNPIYLSGDESDLRSALKEIKLSMRHLKEGKKFGESKKGRGQKVILEFVSANPTGPLNVVSARAAAVGDTLANLLRAAGYKPHKEFYVNDIGNQIDLFAKSLQTRYLQALGKEAAIPEEGYQGEYLKKMGLHLQILKRYLP